MAEQYIVRERFAGRALPQGWYTDTPRPDYRRGWWNCRRADGVIIPLPHDAWTGLRVEIELGSLGRRAAAHCGTDARTLLSLALGPDARGRHQAAVGGCVLQQAGRTGVSGSTARLVFRWTARTMQAEIDGRPAIRASNTRRSARAGSIQLGFRDCRVHRVVVAGTPAARIPATTRRLAPDYPLEVTVDFNDDLMACAWSDRTFDALFAELKSWGARRVSWISLGDAAEAYFDFAPLGIAAHARETIRNVGDIFTAAVRHAHNHGLELVGILKPYDMAIQGFSWPPHSIQAKRNGRIARVGGSVGWATRTATDNQHLIMARKPSACGAARNAIWTRFDFVKDDDAPCALVPEDVTFMVSDDNETFRPYDGPVSAREVVEDYPLYTPTPSGPRATTSRQRARVFRFEGLRIREPFVAVRVRGAAHSFANRLCDLVHIFGEQGEETHLTYGLLARRPYTVSDGDAPDPPPPEPRWGFEFNRYPGSPSSALTSGGDPIGLPLALDRADPACMAFARGKDRGPLAALSPSFPETRALWMAWIRTMLDAGADGIDIRSGHHHADFAWIEYGFEQPVRDEMLRRTGVDIWETDDFDPDLWRRVRGAGWTAFIREASAVVRRRGKTLALHIDAGFDGAPGAGGAMNMVCDWRDWLKEGLADSVTGKALWPGASYSREVVALAHAKGIPVTFAPYSNNFFEDRRTMNHFGPSPRGCHVPVERLIDWGRRNAYDAFLFYECASALRAAPGGAVAFRPGAEPLRSVLRRHFRGKAK